jgi:glutamyl-tRNA synthetase
MAADAVRVRFAPSPTGSLHIGGARTALFNWLFARGKGGAFVLRVEDTDVERSTAESERAVLEDLRWLGLDWDEGPDVGGDHGPYRQSERRAGYAELAHRLLDEGKAYYCYCTKEELAERRQKTQKEKLPPQSQWICRDLTETERGAKRAEGRPESIRFRVPGDPVVVSDLIRGNVEFAGDVAEDFVILRSNGLPTYNFAAVVDDAGMGITHVIRGEEHLPNTNRQSLLYRALGLPEPQYAHISLILNEDRSKMSKRSGEAATFVSEFRDQGYIPEALINFLVLLGWSWDGEREFFTRDELVKMFSLERVNPTPAIFDRVKLEWMNGHYLRNMPLGERVERVKSFLAQRSQLPKRDDLDAFLTRAVAAVGDRLKTLVDIEDYAGFAFSDEFAIDPQAKTEVLEKEGAKENLEAMADVVERVQPFDHDTLEKDARALAEKRGIKAGQLFFPARVALTGKKKAPGLFEVMDLLGRERTVARLRAAVGWFSAQLS